MEERKKDKLEDGTLDDFSIENLDNSLGIKTSIFDDINSTSENKEEEKVEETSSDDIDFDKTYLTNVSNDLAAEVNKVLNGYDEEDEDEIVTVLPDKPIIEIDEEPKEEIVEEPVVEDDSLPVLDEPIEEESDEPSIEELPTEIEEPVVEEPTEEIEEPKSVIEIDEPEIEPIITKPKRIIEEPKEETPVIEEEPVLEDIAPEIEESIEEVVSSEEPKEEIVTEEPSKEVIEEESKVIEEPKEEKYESLLDQKPVREETHKEEPKVDFKSKYIGYETRVIRFSLLFLVFFVLGFFLLYKSININGEEYINYTETSNLDYKVLLKENSFYEEKYLGKDMLYVASLIDKIDIDFMYNFNIDEKVNLDFNYVISGKLSIMDAEGKKVYLTKDYELLPSKTFSLKNEQDHTIIENLVIDYDQYNKLANSFKSTYGLDTTSKLAIYLNVVKSSQGEKIADVNVDNNILIEIPLSERSVSISMDYKDINRQSKLVKKSSISIGNVLLAIISLLFLAVAGFGLYNVLKLLGLLSTKKSKYDKYITKIMRQYDRLIVKHFTCPELSNYNVIKIKEFNELLDMRDNLKMPIMYYNVTDHEKSYFYIVNGNDLYLLVLKAVDLNN